MISWLQARQAGVSEARQQLGMRKAALLLARNPFAIRGPMLKYHSDLTNVYKRRDGQRPVGI
jgi:hypothetical protein